MKKELLNQYVKFRACHLDGGVSAEVEEGRIIAYKKCGLPDDTQIFLEVCINGKFEVHMTYESQIIHLSDEDWMKELKAKYSNWPLLAAYIDSMMADYTKI